LAYNIFLNHYFFLSSKNINLTYNKNFYGDIMREILIIIAILGIVVFASGCVGDTTSEKTFSENGVTFKYPGNWVTLDNETTAFLSEYRTLGDILAAIGTEDQKGSDAVAFVFMSINLEGSRVKDVNDFRDAMKDSYGSDFVSDKKTTIDGEEAIQIHARDSNDANTYMAFWIKNRKGYFAILGSEKENQDTFDSIVNTIETS